MFVSNTGSQPIEDVRPVVGWPSPLLAPDCSGMLTTPVTTLPPPAQDLFPEQVTNCTVTPSGDLTLQPFQTTLFKWDMTINGDVGAIFEFCSRNPS